MMKKFFVSTIAAGIAMAATAAVNVSDLAKYVYPANATASVSLNFTPDGASYLKLGAEAVTIEKYDVATGKLVETVLDLARTRGDRKLERIGGYSLSPDGSKILLYQDRDQIYRRSFRAEYFIYDIKRNTLKPLSTAHPLQQSPVVSPDGRMVAFVAEDNNIYIHKIDYGSEVAVTTDGAKGRIINGVPDWTYEEEFTTSRSMEWAPDNSALAYLRYDETKVPAFSFTLYEGACNPMKQYALYPGDFTYKYPVAGEPNSVVSLHSYDVETRKIKDIALPGTDIEYIPRIHYGPTADKLIVLTLNREQNRLDFFSVNPRSTVVTPIHQEKSSAWIRPECYERVAYEKDNMVIFSDRSGWSHIYRIDYNGNDLGALTSGEFDVTDYYGTASNGLYYYQSTQNGPTNRVITCVNPKKQRAQHISPEAGWSAAQFSPAMNYYVMSHSTTAKAPVYELYKAGGSQPMSVLEDNAEVAARYASVPHKEFFTISNGGNELNGWMIKPDGFDPSRKYPAIIYQYSGPGSQEVKNVWSIDWAQYFAKQGYVIACIDGRGTGGRGREFEQCVYKNLGFYETKDQDALLEHLRGLSFVDPDRIGIYGWSYGGYETLMAATGGAPYAAAAAVAAVTSWRYYDTVYAERYMSTPASNPDGYDRSAPITRVGKLSCPLLMISGTADDNVHLSNTMEFTARLIADNRWPEMLLFPNMNHSIYGCNTRAVVYSRILDFFNSKLGK